MEEEEEELSYELVERLRAEIEKLKGVVDSQQVEINNLKSKLSKYDGIESPPAHRPEGDETVHGRATDDNHRDKSSSIRRRRGEKRKSRAVYAAGPDLPQGPDGNNEEISFPEVLDPLPLSSFNPSALFDGKIQLTEGELELEVSADFATSLGITDLSVVLSKPMRLDSIDAVLRRLHAIPHEATAMFWCHPKDMDENFLDEDEFDDTGSSLGQSKAFLRTGGQVFVKDDGGIVGGARIDFEVQSPDILLNFEGKLVLSPLELSSIEGNSKWHDCPFVDDGSCKWIWLGPGALVGGSSVLVPMGGCAFYWPDSEQDACLFSVSCSALRSSSKSRSKSTASIHSMKRSKSIRRKVPQLQKLSTAGSSRAHMFDLFTTCLRISANLRRITPRKNNRFRESICHLELTANMLSIQDLNVPTDSFTIPVSASPELAPVYGFDAEFGYFVDLTNMVSATGASANKKSTFSGRQIFNKVAIMPMRLFHDVHQDGHGSSMDNQSADLMWKRALSVAKELSSFADGDLFLPSSAMNLETTSVDDAIGQGAYGAVFRVRHEGTDRAVKTVKLHTVPEDDSIPEIEDLLKVYTEAMILIKVRGRHPCLLNLNHICFDANAKPSSILKFHLVTEFLTGGNLGSLLRKKGGDGFTPLPRMQPLLLIRIWKELFSGLQYIHQRDIIHRDIKPENIMLARDIRALTDLTASSETFVRIVDFGQSCSVPGSADMDIDDYSKLGTSNDNFALAMTGTIGTPLYRAPEISGYDAKLDVFSKSRSQTYSKKADIYSATMVMWECWSRERPFMGQEFSDLNKWDMEKCPLRGIRPRIGKDCPAAIAAMIQRGWCHQAKLRPTASDALDEIERLERRLIKSNTLAYFFDEPDSILRVAAYSHMNLIPTQSKLDILQSLRAIYSDASIKDTKARLGYPVLSVSVLERLLEIGQNLRYFFSGTNDESIAYTIESISLLLAILSCSSTENDMVDLVVSWAEHSGGSPLALVSSVASSIFDSAAITFCRFSGLFAQFFGDLSIVAVPEALDLATVFEFSQTFLKLLRLMESVNEFKNNKELWCKNLTMWTQALYDILQAYSVRSSEEVLATVVSTINGDGTMPKMLLMACQHHCDSALLKYVVMLFRFITQDPDLTVSTLFATHAQQWLEEEASVDTQNSIGCPKGHESSIFEELVEVLSNVHNPNSKIAWFWVEGPKENILGFAMSPDSPDLSPIMPYISANQLEFYYQQSKGRGCFDVDLQFPDDTMENNQPNESVPCTIDLADMTVTNHVNKSVCHVVRQVCDQEQIGLDRIGMLQSLGITSTLLEHLWQLSTNIKDEILLKGLEIVQQLLDPDTSAIDRYNESDASMLADIIRNCFLKSNSLEDNGEVNFVALKTAICGIRTIVNWCSGSELTIVDTKSIVFFDIINTYMLKAKVDNLEMEKELRQLVPEMLCCLSTLSKISEFHDMIVCLSPIDLLASHGIRFLQSGSRLHTLAVLQVIGHLVNTTSNVGDTFKQEAANSKSLVDLITKVYDCDGTASARQQSKIRSVFQTHQWNLIKHSSWILCQCPFSQIVLRQLAPSLISIMKYWINIDYFNTASNTGLREKGRLDSTARSSKESLKQVNAESYGHFEFLEHSAELDHLMLDCCFQKLRDFVGASVTKISTEDPHFFSTNLDDDQIAFWTMPLEVPAQRENSFIAITLFQDHTVLPYSSLMAVMETICMLFACVNVVQALGKYAVTQTAKSVFGLFCSQQFTTGEINFNSIHLMAEIVKCLVQWGLASAVLSLTEPRSWLDLLAGSQNSAICLLRKMDRYDKAADFDRLFFKSIGGLVEQRSASLLHTNEDSKDMEIQLQQDKHLQEAMGRAIKVMLHRGHIDSEELEPVTTLLNEHVDAYEMLIQTKKGKKITLRRLAVKYTHLHDWISIHSFIEQTLSENKSIGYKSLMAKLKEKFPVDSNLLGRSEMRINAYLQEKGRFVSERLAAIPKSGAWVAKTRAKAMASKKKRYIVLIGNILKYYESEEDAAVDKELGTILLLPSAAITSKDKSITIDADRNKAAVKLQFGTREDAERWHKMFLSCQM